jgi:SCF-associated factor 1
VGNIITTLEGEVEHVGTEVWKAYDENTPEKQKELDQKVVKIASGLDCIIALKANGEVWYRRVKEGESSAEWEYVSASLRSRSLRRC